MIANEPCFDIGDDFQEKMIMRNSQEARVLKVTEKSTYWQLNVKTLDTNIPVTVRVVRTEFEKKLKAQLRALAANKEWDKFWKKKKFFHSVKHCYSLTVHKSQGSTFQHVIVDVADIYINRDNQNRNQLLYVAITRAAKKVHLML